VAVLGFIAGAFFSRFIPAQRGFQLFTAGSIPYLNLAVGLKVAAGLFGAFLMLAAFREIEKTKEGDGEGD
jgi:multicomponent Na+:H+ antiporter subunit B